MTRPVQLQLPAHSQLCALQNVPVLGSILQIVWPIYITQPGNAQSSDGKRRCFLSLFHTETTRLRGTSGCARLTPLSD